PLGAAILTAVIVWWVWGETSPRPTVHDEASYVLQADIFARFRWTAPTPPIPEFFEQPHVLIVPAVASKYPPATRCSWRSGRWSMCTRWFPCSLPPRPPPC